VLPSLAQALRVREEQGTPLVDLLCAAFRERSGLVVLDNCEQVLAAMSDIEQLLTADTRMHVLATSREPLGVEGERIFLVAPLAQPDPLAMPSLEERGSVPSIALFVERARAVEPNFTLSVDKAAAVADICARLDGLPLAIELAAARCPALTVRAMAARLRERLDVLSSDTPGRPARHQTIEATLAWSYDLLTPEEQVLFRYLSVFARGATLEAVEGVCELPEVLSGLASLVRKNLLQMSKQPNGYPRYRMLDMVQLYARDLLRGHGEEELVRGRHAAFFCQLAEAAEPRLSGPEREHWVHRLEWDYENLRAALHWAYDADRVEIVVRLAGSLAVYWSTRGPLTEGREWLERASGLADGEPAPARAKVASGLGTMLWCFKEFRDATTWHQVALDTYSELDDTKGQAFSLYNLAVQALQLGDYERAGTLLKQCEELYNATGDRWGLAGALQVHGRWHCSNGTTAGPRGCASRASAITGPLATCEARRMH
jgi:non-specific serine/threonine protein kinase